MSKKPPPQQQWRPDVTTEQCKLAPKESDWNLPQGTPNMTRTRHGGTGRPWLNRNTSNSSSSSDSDGSTYHPPPSASSSFSDDTLSSGIMEAEERPSPFRVIVEVDQVKRTLEEFGKCKECQGPVEALLKTKGFGLATKIELACLDTKCSFVHHGQEPAHTKIHDAEEDNNGRLTDYAVNCLYVLAFIAAGDGAAEAEKLLGLLGMPNDTSMKSSTFQRIETRIGPFIRDVAEEILLENIKREVKETVDGSHYEQWERAIDPGVATAPLPADRYPRLKVSFDGAWQQKSAGHKRDSPSGHGLIFGHKTRLPLCYEIKSKICDYCATQKKRHPGRKKEDYPAHDCTINFDGSSGAMEAAQLVELVTRLHHKFQVQAAVICCDDDSSVRCDCQWNNATYLKKYNTTKLPQVKITRGKNKGKLQDRPDNGKLHESIDEPKFVSDPNHRGKLFTGDLYAMEQGNVEAKATITRMDTTRLGKNFKYMGRTLANKDPSKYIDCAKAVLEHHFECHEYCDESWCRRKNMTPQDRLQSKQYYRDKVKDKALYECINDMLSIYITQEKLADIAHGMDTNANESFNNTCAWLAPKNKVYCGSRSLWNRVCVAIGLVSLGPEQFYRRILKALGIQLTPGVAHYLRVIERQRGHRLVQQRTNKRKLERNKRKFERLQLETLIAKKERLKRAGKYRRGMNLDITAAEEECILPIKVKPPVICPHPFCRLKGHKTTRSKACKANPERLQKDGTAAACAAAVAMAAAQKEGPSQDEQAQLAAADLSLHEAVPLLDGDDSSLDLFLETHTWSEDEDGNITAII